MAKQLYEADILLAVAKAQGVIRMAAIQILKRDKTDGIRAVEWLKSHDQVYRKIADDCRGNSGADEATINKADELAGSNTF